KTGTTGSPGDRQAADFSEFLQKFLSGLLNSQPSAKDPVSPPTEAVVNAELAKVAGAQQVATAISAAIAGASGLGNNKPTLTKLSMTVEPLPAGATLYTSVKAMVTLTPPGLSDPLKDVLRKAIGDQIMAITSLSGFFKKPLDADGNKTLVSE